MSIIDHLNGTVNTEFRQDDQSKLFMEAKIAQNELSPHGKVQLCMDDNSSPIVDGENVCLQSPSNELGGKSFVMKVPRANSKLILQNMEEVLNSVKKKHRQKHRRKKEQKKLAMLAEAEQEQEQEKAEQPGVSTANGESNGNDNKDASPSTSKPVSNNASRVKNIVKKPLQEQQAVQDQSSQPNHIGKGKHYISKRRKASISPLKSTMTAETSGKSNNILNHFIRTPKKNDVQENSIKNPRRVPENKHSTQKSTPTNKPTTNAFLVMMNARNKTIGSSTPGKEVSITDESSTGSTAINAKRKLMLQSWAERKGGLKRKLDDEMRAAFIEERLDYRAKRLKKMLTNGSPRGAGTAKGITSEPDLKNEQETSSGPNNKTKRHRKTSTRRSRRLSSADSVEVNSEKTPALDPETEEFLSKLSSPTKKRDSLLGYFAKVPSPNDVSAKSAATKSTASTVVTATKKQQKLAKNEPSTPRKRGRTPKTVLHNVVDVIVVQSPEKIDYIAPEPQPQTETPTVRPKRACAERAKYDYDLEGEESPQKQEPQTLTPQLTEDCLDISGDKQRRSKRKQRRSSIISDQSVDDVLTITLDSSSSFNVLNATTKTPKKLAPLFVRSVPKPSPDPETLKARQDFLRSGVPDKLKLEQERQKQYEQCYEEAIELFPKISHLQQWNYDDKKFLAESPFQNKTIRLRSIDELFNASHDNCRSNSNNRKTKTTKVRHSLLGITNCAVRDFRTDKKSIRNANLLNGSTTQQLLLESLPIVSNKRIIIKAWKADFDRFPTYKCYNQLRTKYRFFSVLDSTQDTEQVTESFVVTRSTRRSLEASSMSPAAQQNADLYLEEDVKPPATAPNGELLFTEKYKPLLFEQVLVNLTPVSQLRDFLANWANGNGGGSAKNSQSFADDSVDFMNDSNSSQQTICNSVVLLGPASSGKTNAVFTLANEMNFNVLEINAGMKRTGKKLIQELLEATQSHQIRNESTGGSAVKSKAQKNLLKMSLKSLKGRKRQQTSSSNNATEPESSAVTDLNVRKCLILIEDADIVFEQMDAGFTDAIYTLAASSKRPVIVVATNPNCQHLQRLMSQNTIKFTAPNALSISKYLAVLSLMENCPVSLDDLISLYLYNQHDLRKTLHELQFFIQSGGDRNKHLRGAEDISIEKRVQKQRTPQKENEHGDKFVAGKYFASPGKRRLSEDSLSVSGAVHDEQLKRETHHHQQQQQSNQEELYLHRTLFEFYTVDQNAKWRIPFPVNFDLFYVNLNDIFAIAKKLKPPRPEGKCETNASVTSKRKTRSPKKVWLSTATANEVATEKSGDSQIPESLDALSSFYNNVSIATLIVARDKGVGRAEEVSRHERDRLMPYLSESIAHDILEHAINFDLEAELCPYNLFETRKKSNTLCDLMGSTMAMFPKRARSMDCEPALRAICRSEQQRAAQERRSTRFYHYLRNSCVDISNFSQGNFDSVCEVFQTQQKQKLPGENDTSNSGKNLETFFNIQ